VELQGGQLTVQSEPGRGSTFSFELRLKATHPTRTAQTEWPSA
jgi:signal transduction histidine kinase